MKEEDVEEGVVIEEKGVESLSVQEDRQDRKSSSAKLPRPEEPLSSGASWLALLAVQWVGLVPASHSAARSLALAGVPREHTSAWLPLSSAAVTCWLV